MIASDRTGDGERRRGPVAGGSSAWKEPEIKGRSVLAVARRAAAEIVPTPVARRSSGSGDRPVVGGRLDRRTIGVRHQGGGDLHVSVGRRSRLAVRRDQEGAVADLATASRGDGDGTASTNRQHQRAARR